MVRERQNAIVSICCFFKLPPAEKQRDMSLSF